jgi:hypothetical protein
VAELQVLSFQGNRRFAVWLCMAGSVQSGSSAVAAAPVRSWSDSDASDFFGPALQNTVRLGGDSSGVDSGPSGNRLVRFLSSFGAGA